ncbi:MULTISPECIES: hypothetical protein [unclassified Myxococcus]|uniref:hypothetical protein n=1 Tax=unclassified Myxococcus TaxID=2648731 RepID=UPI00157ADCF2|nr:MULTISPECIES: hypothetical protein [unclassified Myxococcus]NTX35556.1 hypothetical protein [Myxococcus sp. CA033]NTX51754.1 hypothetical protein [Myxococcus sp. CA039A]
MMETPSVFLLAATSIPLWLGIPLFVVGLLALAFFSSLKGGWFWLARRFRTDEPMPRGAISGVTGRMGWVHYRNSLTVGADEDGLYISMIPVVMPFHPPLFIPWSEVRERKRETPFLSILTKFDRLEVGPKRTVVRIESLVMDGLGRYLPLPR